MATEKIIEYSRKALPYLIYCAQQRKTTTYQELAQYAGCHHRVTPHILGYVRDEICAPRDLPYLNAIVTRKDTGQPGDAWLPEGTSHLSEEEYRVKYELFRDRAFAFEGWNALLTELSLQPITLSEEDLKERGREYSRYIAKHGLGGEKDPHRNLKVYIANHPEALGLPAYPKGDVEHMFISGDCCDVLFTRQNQFTIIEIKNGDPGELVRGIYQLIKYRALLAAEEELSEASQPAVHLVAYRIPTEVQALAAKFAIQCHMIPSIPDSDLTSKVN